MDATKELNQILKSIDVSLKELVKLKRKELDKDYEKRMLEEACSPTISVTSRPFQ